MKCLVLQATGAAMLEGHRWEEAGPVLPTSTSYKNHSVRTQILADVPLGVCFSVRCYLSCQMMDLCGHTTKSKSTACPEGTLPQKCLQQGTEKVNRSPPSLPSFACRQAPLLKGGLLAELLFCL